jgi:hypothetical protein
MTAPADRVAAASAAIAARLGAASASLAVAPATHPDRVVLELTHQYPGDVGVFAPYLLNVLELQPGEAIFLAANEPHAYLAGGPRSCVSPAKLCGEPLRAGLRRWLTKPALAVKAKCQPLVLARGAHVQVTVRSAWRVLTTWFGLA